MSKVHKSQSQILDKLNITFLNAMQEKALENIKEGSNVVLLSPTGTGKTLAFLLPLLEILSPKETEVQAMVLVPSRELALQIEQVFREMGSGYKVNAIYGGRAGAKDKEDLVHKPAVLIGTPGRIADHMRRGSFCFDKIKTLVLDEFDKSLEVGFEEDMKDIIGMLKFVETRVLTSATQGSAIPEFVRFNNPTELNFLGGETKQLSVKTIVGGSKDKLDALLAVLRHHKNEPGIIFCNFKDSINFVSDFLENEDINHGCFHGDMEQRDRERSLIKFRNGTHHILLATDLAARGIDVPELKFIIHYQLPPRNQEFTHRNGRTARMNQEGSAYLLKSEKEKMPDFIRALKTPQIDFKDLKPIKNIENNSWKTLYISGGRKDKISKGDIAGLFMKKGGLKFEEVGRIELKTDCAFVAVSAEKANMLCQKFNNTRLKNRKIRVGVS